jgi:nucleoid-associated protein YgaU
MGLLDALLGAGQGREEHQGFLQRFEQGPPWEGYSDQEVLKEYGTVAGQASRQEYEQAARDTFARLTPEQRVEFGRLLQQRARERQVNVGDLERSGISDFQDASRLARLTSSVHEQPGLLRSILGGGGGGQGQEAGLLGSPLAKAALAGIAAMAIKRMLAGRTAQAAGGAGPTTAGGPTIPSPGEAMREAGAQTSPGGQRAESPRTTTEAARGETVRTERWHEVTRDETLSRLAAKYYGDGNLWMKIFEANRDVLTDPDLIRVGQKLRIP